MNIDLTGKIALITGAASGIGRQCARTLAASGATIVAVDINIEGAEDTISGMDHATAIKCNLADPEAIVALKQQVVDELGGVDILVNCAGIISYRKGLRAVSTEEWDLVLDVNLRGTFLLCREFIEVMKERRGGKIVSFSSLAARVGGIDVGVHYAASKAGLLGFTRTLAKEGGPYGITVNAVAPGFIATEPVKRQIGDREEEYASTIPLGRLGQPEDVANVVLFLVSPLSDYVTGIVLDINGGLYMG